MPLHCRIILIECSTQQNNNAKALIQNDGQNASCSRPQRPSPIVHFYLVLYAPAKTIFLDVVFKSLDPQSKLSLVSLVV